MPLEADKRNLIILFAAVAGCILIGAQFLSYSRLSGKTTTEALAGLSEVHGLPMQCYLATLYMWLSYLKKGCQHYRPTRQYCKEQQH